MVDRKLYSKDYEPIVQPKEYLEFFPRDFLKDGNLGVLVEMVYPLPLRRVDLVDSNHFSASLTTTETAESEKLGEKDLHLDQNELGQYRIIPESDFKITHLAIPKARPLWWNKVGTFHLQTIEDDPRTNPAVEMLQHNEFFLWEDTDVYIKAQANSTTLTAAYLAIFGWRFICTPVRSFPTGIRPLRIPVTGYSGATK